MRTSSPLRTESGLGFSDPICNGDKGMGIEIFSSSRGLQSEQSGQPHGVRLVSFDPGA